jgi:pyruvate formate lyase activating enzyme
MAEVSGRIHSIETGGMVDGPGLRFVVFLQGCPLRCQYCHNPDTWKKSGGRETTSSEIVWEACKYRTWMETSGGGITLTGGEPLFQPEFTLDIIRKAHEKGLHVALDTSGFAPAAKARACLEEADLILLDIKAASPLLHKRVTGVESHPIRDNLEFLKRIGKPLWIRHVVVPGLTDEEKDLDALLELVKSIPSLEKLELLPFYKMGEDKWKEEGIPYSLTDTPVPAKEFMSDLRERFSREGIPL